MWSVSAPVTRSSYARDTERAQAAERSDLIRRWGCKVRRSASLAGVVVRDRRDSRFLPLRSSRFQKPVWPARSRVGLTVTRGRRHVRTSPTDSLRLRREAHVGEARALDLPDVQPPAQLPVRDPSSVRPDEVKVSTSSDRMNTNSVDSKTRPR